MKPQDPNSPQEIPPIPPPHNDGDGDFGDGSIFPQPDTNTGTAGEDSLFSPAASANDIGNEPGSYASADNDLGDSEAKQSKSNRGDGQAEPSNNSTPNQSAAAAAQSNGLPYNPDPAPWTDSDLQNVEDPLPLPTSEPEPTYTVRNQEPDSAAVSNRSTRPVPPAEDVWADTGIPYQPKELGVVDQLLLVLAEGVTLWKKGLRWVRSQLPPNLRRQLSDEILTAIAVGLLVLFLALWNPLGSGKGQPSVASEPLPSNTSVATDTKDLFAEPSPDAELPAASEPAPAPQEPTPEQSLITDIQDRVSSISRSYGAGLIQSVEVNLPENTLGVNVAEAWYGLLTAQQDEVAQDIFAQAQGLKFGTLQLRDPNGVVVARNPVVGTNMVVLRRQQSLDADWRTE